MTLATFRDLLPAPWGSGVAVLATGTRTMRPWATAQLPQGFDNYPIGGLHGQGKHQDSAISG